LFLTFEDFGISCFQRIDYASDNADPVQKYYSASTLNANAHIRWECPQEITEGLARGGSHGLFRRAAGKLCGLESSLDLLDRV